MQCIGQGQCRFTVRAGPEQCVDRRAAVHELVAKAAGFGVYGVRADVDGRTRYRFELDATTPEQACEVVTVLFRAVYGLNWWAEVSAIRAAPYDGVQVLSWN